MRIIRKFRLLLLLICIIVFSYSAYQLISYYYEGYKNEQEYKEIRAVYDFNKISNIEETKGGAQEDTSALRRESFAALKEINADAVAWVHVPNTNIDYPVVQGEDNSYYLEHTVERAKSRVGSIFMDFRNSLDDDSVPKDYNTIIYGHHLKSGAMFTSLKEFKDKNFFDENRYVYLDTPGGTLKYEIFSVIITDADYNYIETYFASEDEFLAFISDIRDRALYNSGAVINEGEKILTLSTCTYEYEDARLAVFARLIED